MILIADDLWRKSHASDWEEVRPLQRVLKMKIDGTPRNRETTLESAVWQATSRKAREKWRTPASRVIPKTRRIEAISPRIRKGSVTRTWERMEILGIAFATSPGDEFLISTISKPRME